MPKKDKKLTEKEVSLGQFVKSSAESAIKNIEILAGLPGNISEADFLKKVTCKKDKEGVVNRIVVKKAKRRPQGEDDDKMLEIKREFINSLAILASQANQLDNDAKSKIQKAIHLMSRLNSSDLKLPNEFKSLSRIEKRIEIKREWDLESAGIKQKKPMPEKDGQYILSEGQNKADHLWEAKWIGIETQLKRLLRLTFGRFTKKFDYFQEGENKDPSKIYEKPQIEPVFDKEGEVKIHNISHASQLIQTNGINVLTDPAFGKLAPIFYPAMTKAAVKPEALPAIDVMVISHNHRDHMDIPTLKRILKSGQNPIIIVPPGKDKKLVESLGFTNVVELNWFEKAVFEKNGKKIEITATAADHWTNRSMWDPNLSSVNSYVITPSNGKGVVYFAGDTAVMSEKRMESIAAILRLEMMGLMATGKDMSELKIYNLEPGGPNYSRKLMKTTHQSAVDSILSSFKIAKHIVDLDRELAKSGQGESSNIPASEWLNNTLTVFMHHNKFELGPDRFNENLKIYQKLINILENTDKMSDLLTTIDTLKKKNKPNLFDRKIFNRKLFNRSDDFIYEGAVELLKMSADIQGKHPTRDFKDVKEELIASLKNQVEFPKIGATISSDNKRASPT